ncbi:hypothetical protein T01_5776 [Trichinella spiralis]|uniref:Uncharacterized protein n=1 Tax=Trichinella spiralis TaxID=6334 RepID=A0A0V0YWZ9_TRISP|nr:hypothetical protein T01_5776 [Trichinella spiralis]
MNLGSASGSDGVKVSRLHPTGLSDHRHSESRQSPVRC